MIKYNTQLGAKHLNMEAPLAKQVLARMGIGTGGTAVSGNISSITNGVMNSSESQRRQDYSHQTTGGSQPNTSSKDIWIIAGVAFIILASIIIAGKSLMMGR